MDSQLAAVLTSSRAALMNRAHLPEGTGKSVEMLPLTDIQDVPIDLSLKSSCSLPPDSQPLCLKLTPSSNNKAKQFYWAETTIQGRTSEMNEDNTDTLEIVAEVTGVHKPILSNTDPLPTSCMESFTSGFTGCLSEQKAVTCEPCPNEQSDHPTASQVTVKEEIEEVCIGEMEGYSEDCSDSPISLSEINTEDKDTAGGIADGTDTQSTVVSGANSDKVPADTITALKTELENIAVDGCGFRTRDASTSERQLPDMNGNITSVGAGTQIETQAQINSGTSSDSSELPINGSPAEGEGKEMKARKGRKESTSLTVVPTYSICTRSQRRREINREAKEECGKGKNTHLWKERKQGEELLQSSPPISDLPRVSEGLCKTEKEQEEGADADEIEKGRGFKRKMEEEVLDLSLSRKGGWSDTDRRSGGLEEGAGSEATLLMEVDEILQQEVEEEEDEEVKEEDAQVLSREKEMAVNFDSVNLEAPLSSSPPPSSPSASPSSSPVDPSLDSLLLIDDQGIPYMLTPDGQKLFQVELPKPCNAFTARPRPMSKQVKAEDSTVICSPDVAPSKPGSLSTLPYQASGVSPSCLTSPASSESSVISKTVLPSGTTSSTEAASQPPTLLDLAPKPIRILANPTTTSPILLLPSSHLPSLSSSKSNTNSGLMALSLPLSLTQKSPSTPLFLVISPLTTGSAPSSSSSALAVNNPVPSSLPVKQISSPSTVPISSVETNLDSSLPSSPSLPALNPDSSMLSTSILGNSNQSTPTSPSVSSTFTKQPNSDLSSRDILPKCSPLQSTLEPDPPSDTKSTSIADTQIQCVLSPIPAPLSPTEAPPNSPTHSLKAAPSPASKPSPTPHTSADLFFPDDSSYPTSGTPPPATIFPTNHPKSLSLSPNCPRRILYCQFCPRAFYYLSDLERHSITHSQSKPHVCPLCSKAFKRSSHLERHKHIHTGQRNFICPICSKRFREAGELLRHQRVHTGEKPFQCPQCHMRFAERNTLRRHAKRKHQDQQGPDGQEEGCHVSDGGQEDAEWYSCTVPELDSDREEVEP